MNISGEMYRLNGRWVIEIETEQWILDDILYDAETSGRPLQLSIKKDTTVRGGTTRFEWNVLGQVEVIPETTKLEADVTMKDVSP